MKLNRLISCDIYRDRGSMEGVWITDEEVEWSVTLKIKKVILKADEFKNRKFTLHNSKLVQFSDENRIIRGSKEHERLIFLISEWYQSLQKTEIAPRLDEFVDLLSRGNY